MKPGQLTRMGAFIACLSAGLSVAGCGAMRGQGPSEDVAFSAAAIDRTTAKSAAVSVLELLRLASEEAMPQDSPREAAFLKAIDPLVDEATLTAALKTSRTGKPITAAPAPKLLATVLRQWPLLMAFYREGLQVDQAIEQLTVPPLDVTAETMAVFVPAVNGDASIWLGFKCVPLEDGWKVYDFGLYTNPPQPPVSIDAPVIQ